MIAGNYGLRGVKRYIRKIMLQKELKTVLKFRHGMVLNFISHLPNL